MRKSNDRLILGYDRFKATVGVSAAVFGRELEEKSRELGAPDFSSMIQVHGNRIAQAKPGVIHPETDALVSDRKGLMLYGCFADCLPIYVWDEDKALIGLAHAGWKGTAGRIAQLLVERLIELGASELSAFIGPGICAKHYQVSAGFDQLLKPVDPGAFISEKDRFYFDLFAENRAQLEQYLPAERITQSDSCTFSDPAYYSYRRDQQTRGRNLAYLMLK